MLGSDLLQHLTTFVLDRKDGMVSVEDGVRRLRLLEAKGKVWTQEMVLQVEKKNVSLLDPDSKVPCTCRYPGSQKVPGLSRSVLAPLRSSWRGFRWAACTWSRP